MHTQGCHGCQMTRNFVRNSKILIARSTIQPKLSKIKNHQEIHQNSLKNGKLFLILLHFGWMVDLAMSIFEFLTKFLVFWHPWHPWVFIRSDLKPLETDISDSSYCAGVLGGVLEILGFSIHYSRRSYWVKKIQAAAYNGACTVFAFRQNMKTQRSCWIALSQYGKSVGMELSWQNYE